jgi:hypothetical protein
MEASMFFETLCILPQNYTALQTRTLWIESSQHKKIHISKYFHSEYSNGLC